MSAATVATAAIVSLGTLAGQGAAQQPRDQAPPYATTRKASPASFDARPVPFVDTLYLGGRGAVKQIEALARVTSEPGRSLLLYTIDVANGGSRDSIWLSVPTLAPLRHVATAGGDGVDVAFIHDSAVGTRTDSSGRHTIHEAVPDAAFDFSSLPLILRYLPVSVGDSGVLRMFDVERGAQDLGYTVTAEPSTSPLEPSGLVAITVDFGRWRTTYRIQPKDHKYLGYDIAPPNGARRVGGRRAPSAP